MFSPEEIRVSPGVAEYVYEHFEQCETCSIPMITKEEKYSNCEYITLAFCSYDHVRQHEREVHKSRPECRCQSL